MLALVAMAFGVLFVSAGLLGGEYMPDPSYVCLPPLDDFFSPRPPVRQTEMFDPAPPCWDAARRRVATTAVVVPLGIAFAAGTTVFIKRRRSPLVPLAAYMVVLFVAFVAGWPSRY